MAILQKYGILTNPAYDAGIQDATADAAPQEPPQSAAQPAPMPTILQPQPTYRPNPLRMAQEHGLQQSLLRQENKPSPTGFWGKAGHILSNVANAAGNVILGGNNMAMIPGTQQNAAAQHNATMGELQGLEKQDQQEQQQFGENQLRGAQTAKVEAETPSDEEKQAGLEHTEAETAALGRPDLAHAYATAVQSAMQKGEDPSQDPVVQHLADAITSIQKQTAPKEDQTKTADLLGPDGKQHLMGWDAKTSKYDIDMGLKGEKPTSAPGVTLMVPNPQGGYSVQRAGVGQSVAPGAMTPAGMSSLSVPTSSTRTMVETAPRVLELADRAEQLIDPQVQALGPTASRWAEFMAGKVGAPNPQFTALRTNIGLLTTALMRMHVGARGGEQIMQHFQDLIDSSKQSPENLKSALEEIKQYANQVKTELPGGGNKGAGNSQPTRPANVPEGYIFKDGPKGKGWYKP